MRRQIRLELQRILKKKKSGSEQSSVSKVCANSYLWNLYYFLFEEVILRIDLELRKMTDRWISFDCQFLFTLSSSDLHVSAGFWQYHLFPLCPLLHCCSPLMDYVDRLFFNKKLLTFPLCLKQIVHLPFPKGVFLNGFFLASEQKIYGIHRREKQAWA